MYAQRLRNGSIFSPVQSSFEISLRKASSADCGGATQNAAHPRESWSDTEVLNAPTSVFFTYYMLQTW